MKLNSEGCEEALLSCGAHHLSPPTLPPFKGDDLEEDSMAGEPLFSPARKSLKSDPASRLHCIPVLMVFVFFILWAASSEVDPDDQIMAPLTKVDKSAGPYLKVAKNEIKALPGSRTVLFQDKLFRSKHSGDPSLRNKEIAFPRRSYIRGNARFAAR